MKKEATAEDVVRATNAYRAFLTANPSIKNRQVIDAYQIERSNGEVIEAVKGAAARSMANFLIESGRFHFEKLKDERISGDKAFPPDLFRQIPPDFPEHIYESEMFVFSREELDKALTQFASDILSELSNVMIQAGIWRG
jgi:hypothetical protein